MFGQLVSFENLIPPFPIGVAAIFFFLQSHYMGMLRSQSSSSLQHHYQHQKNHLSSLG